MAIYLLDTDICSYAISGPSEILRAHFRLHGDEIAISCVTLFELYTGAEKSSRPERNRRNVRDFAGRLELIVFGLEEAKQAADIRATLEKVGTPIGAYDIQIAATARARGLVMVTNNTREFIRVPGLRVENWTEK